MYVQILNSNVAYNELNMLDS